MKKIASSLLIFLLLPLAACTPVAEQIMPPLTYNNHMTFHDVRKANLYWQSGVQISSELPNAPDLSNGVSGLLLSSIVDSEMRNARPGDFTLTYGKAQEVVFMTSLRNTLIAQHAFKDVTLITDPNASKSPDVLITVNFKQTKVLGPHQNYQIILNTELSIKESNKPLFIREYAVQSDSGSIFSHKSFKTQQTDVSEQLLEKIIGGITEWQAKTK